MCAFTQRGPRATLAPFSRHGLRQRKLEARSTPSSTLELRIALMSSLMATTAPGNWWQYLALFLAVTASWAGVPFIGAAATGAAGVAASQGNLILAWVIVVTIVAGEIGGVIGYGIGDRWGRQLLQRPGKHQEGRVKLVEKGEAAYRDGDAWPCSSRRPSSRARPRCDSDSSSFGISSTRCVSRYRSL